MVENDHTRTMAQGVISIGIALLIGVIIRVLLFSDSQSLFPLSDGELFGLIIMLILYLGGVYLLIDAERWEQINERRQMAAAWGFAAHVPLANPHPLPNVGALPLPFTIKLKTNWPQALVFWCLLAEGLFLVASSNALLEGMGLLAGMQQALQIPNLLGRVFGPFLCFTPAMIQLTSPQQIEVTPEGLIIYRAIHHRSASNQQSRKQLIRWSDARLFAIRGGKPDRPATRYELSSPYVVVKWQRIRRPRWWSLHRPAIPFAEYDAQMEALIALISGITGLPLYDVR